MVSLKSRSNWDNLSWFSFWIRVQVYLIFKNNWCYFRKFQHNLDSVWQRKSPTFFPDKDNQFFLSSFPADVQSGLLEVVSPSPHYYPNFSNVKENFGDSKDRVKYVCHCFLLLWQFSKSINMNNFMTQSLGKQTCDNFRGRNETWLLQGNASGDYIWFYIWSQHLSCVSPYNQSIYIQSIKSFTNPNNHRLVEVYKVLYFIQIFTLSLLFLRWRTKQNLDFSYLMRYAHDKGTYYIQVSW